MGMRLSACDDICHMADVQVSSGIPSFSQVPPGQDDRAQMAAATAVPGDHCGGAGDGWR